MTYDDLFKELKPTEVMKVRIKNGGHIPAKGKGTIAIITSLGIKKISDVLYVHDTDKNLLSICQLIEKGFKVSFEDWHCFIHDATGQEILRVKMIGKSLSFDPIDESTQLIPLKSASSKSGIRGLDIVIFNE